MIRNGTKARRFVIVGGIAVWLGGIALGYFSEQPWRFVGFTLHIVGLGAFLGACFYSPPVIPEDANTTPSVDAGR